MNYTLPSRWRIVLLKPRSKEPIGRAWNVTKDQNIIEKHVATGGNIGLVCGPDSGVAVLDFDQTDAMRQMAESLAPVRPWVETGRGRFHCYIRWEADLPARLMWRGENVGEVQRGPGLQHVVMPPSIHPETGREYRWLVDPSEELPPLPEEWRNHFASSDVPSYIPKGDRAGQPPEEQWTGAPPEVLVQRALQQPGARRRHNGIKFQCLGCRRVGRDRSRDNAIVYWDGHWGCAVDHTHKAAIAEQLRADDRQDVADAIVESSSVQTIVKNSGARDSQDFVQRLDQSVQDILKRLG